MARITASVSKSTSLPLSLIHILERYFPEHRVRYLSLLDGVDTGVDSTANDITPFRAIMNDMYAKDISKKIKSVKHDKQRKGQFIGGKAVYGYKPVSYTHLDVYKRLSLRSKVFASRKFTKG